MKNINQRSIIKMVLFLISIAGIAYGCRDPHVQDDFEPEAQLKNVVKINFRGKEWQTDTIKEFDINKFFPFVSSKNRIYYYVNVKLHHNQEEIQLICDFYFFNDDTIGYAGLLMRNQDTTMDISVNAEQHRMTYVKIKRQYENNDTAKNIFTGKYLVEPDSTHTEFFEDKPLKIEFTNLERQVTYMDNFEYAVDSTREYSYNRKWYLVGIEENAELKKPENIPYYCERPTIRFFIEKVDDETLFKYDKLLLIEDGISTWNLLVGSWTLKNDTVLIHLHEEPPSYHVDRFTHWDYEWGTFYHGIFDNNAQKWIEKENNILKVYYNNKKSALVYYAKPEEYNDTLVYKHDDILVHETY